MSDHEYFIAAHRPGLPKNQLTTAFGAGLARVSRLAVCLVLAVIAFAPALASASTAPGVAPQSALNQAAALGASYATPADVVAALAGPGISVSNITYQGSPNALGVFTGGSSIVGFEQGALIGTGDISSVVGPNISDETTTEFLTPGDPELAALTGYDSFDAATLDFDFVPNGGTFTFRYVYASEEYNEYVYSTYEDAFLLLVNGVNCATVGSQRVSINSINAGNPIGRNPSNQDLFVNNDLTDGGGGTNTEMDGLTVVMTCTGFITPDVTNHMRLTIADTFDARLDSVLFLELGSLSANQAPNAFDDSAVTDQDSATTVAVLANDSDPDGDALTVTAVTQGANGAVSINPDNTVTYAPAAGFAGTDSFTYAIADPYGAPDMATVSVTVNAIPTATPTNTLEPTATNTLEPTATDAAVPTATNTPEPTATDTVEPTATDTAEATATSPVEPTATDTATAESIPTDTPTSEPPTATSTVEPTATNTAEPTATTPVNQPPSCAVATPSMTLLWPPNGDFYPITILSVGDPDGGAVAITITNITQDEAVSKDGPDAKGIGGSTAQIRALRDGSGNGRVYHILFTAADANGGICSGDVIVSVPHDSDEIAVDDGQVRTFDSTKPAKKNKNK